jgi:hypothetical protein
MFYYLFTTVVPRSGWIERRSITFSTLLRTRKVPDSILEPDDGYRD